MCAATVVVSEYNGAGPEASAVKTESIANMNYGSTDAVNIVAADYPITPNTNTYKGSFTKFNKLSVQAMGGVSIIKDIKFWRVQGSPTSGDLHKTNATMASYEIKTYTTPSTALITYYVVESSEPATANVGINSSLTGQITSVAVQSLSDLIYHQIQVSSSTTAGAILTVRYSWTEVS